jgi:hypothetical protein
VGEETTGSVGLDRPVKPHREERQRQAERHVEIRIGTAQEGSPLDHLAGFIDAIDADGADSREQSHPVGADDEDENGAEKPEGIAGQLGTHDGGEEILEPFDHGFQQVLESGRHQADLAGGELRDEDDHCGDQPHGDHRVGDLEKPQIQQNRRIERQFVMPIPGGLERKRESEEPGGDDGGKMAHAWEAVAAGARFLIRISHWASSKVENFRQRPALHARARHSGAPTTEWHHKSSRQRKSASVNISGFSLAKGIPAPHKLPLP